LNVKWQQRIKKKDIIQKNVQKHQHRAENDGQETSSPFFGAGYKMKG